MKARPTGELADLGEKREDASVGFGRLRAAAGRLREPTADLEILRDGQVGEEPAIFRRVADAETGALVCGQRRDVLALKSDFAGAHRQQPDDAVDRGRLARAIAADQADRLLFSHRKRYRPENLRPAPIRVDALDLKHGSNARLARRPSP